MHRRSLLLAALLSSGAGQDLAAEIIPVGFLGTPPPPRGTESPVDEVAPDAGLAGARLGIRDNDGTGRFTGQRFTLSGHMLAPGEDAVAAATALADGGIRFLVACLPAAVLQKVLDAPALRDVLILNAAAPEDALRNESCRANLLHTAVSHAMLADGLAQYLVWKRWPRWFLVVGRQPGDALYAAALHRAAERFGAEIVAEKPWRFEMGQGRTDTGYVTLQTEIPAFTRVRDHDVLVVADEGDEFGAYLEGRTARPRPVAGTHGLVATGWSPVTEAWGATQLQNRFHGLAGRRMTAWDYAAWLAVRAVGQAAIRGHTSDPTAITARMRGPDFLLAGFKGQGLSFRDWDGQMRQPVLIAGPRLLVSASPQPGFLHQVTPLDTLGYDRPESGCKL